MLLQTTRTHPSTGLAEHDVEIVKFMVADAVSAVYRDHNIIVRNVDIKYVEDVTGVMMLACTASYDMMEGS